MLARSHMMRALPLVLLAACVACASLPASSPGASSSVTVAATILGATAIDATACTSTPSTDFGALQPGATAITGGDCTVEFGSSNATARLRMTQRDGVGSAMVGFTSGTRATDLGGTGVATVNLPASGYPSSSAYMDRAVDGSTLYAGYDATQALVTKVGPNGALDLTFGGGDGVADVLPTGATRAYAYTVDARPDGTILLAGYATRSNNDVFVARLLADGTPDPSFGTGGIVVESLTTGTDLLYAISVDAAGNVVATGSQLNGPSFDGVIIRYRSDGSRDTTFGTGGAIATGTPTVDERFTELDFDSNGRIIVASTIADQAWDGTGATWRDISVRRYLPSGLPDGAWGTAGLVTMDRSPLNDFVTGLEVDHLDRPVLTGITKIGNNRGIVSRFRSTDGGLDATFAAGGTYDYDPTTYNDNLYDVHELDDGTIAAIGTTPPDGLQFSTGILRLSSTGTMVAATVVDLLPTSDNIRGGYLDGDGGVVVVGYVTTSPVQVVVGHLAGRTIADYGTVAANTWQGGTASLFGTCLRSLTGATASAPWSVDGNAACTAVDTDPWRSVARQPSEVGATTVVGATATANLRFGIRTQASQAPGGYASMVKFEVLAP